MTHPLGSQPGVSGLALSVQSESGQLPCGGCDETTQLPPLHVPVQVFPHPPQLLRSLDVSVHVPLHTLSPAVQHWPWVQVCPPVHAIPQVPQFCESVFVSTQLPLHKVMGELQLGPVSVPGLLSCPVWESFAPPSFGGVDESLVVPPSVGSLMETP